MEWSVESSCRPITITKEEKQRRNISLERQKILLYTQKSKGYVPLAILKNVNNVPLFLYLSVRIEIALVFSTATLSDFVRYCCAKQV